MNATDLSHLNGQSVLVKSTQDHRNPPIALRGTIEVRTEDGQQIAEVLLEFPDMCNQPAHQRVIPLDADAVECLLAGRREGGFEYTIDGPLDPAADPAAANGVGGYDLPVAGTEAVPEPKRAI
jgi:hypothetical protein